MPSFISDVLNELKNQEVELSQLTFILPSKRAGVFLRHEIAAQTTKTIFSPTILSIEEFVEELSQLKSITNTELLFEFYQIYLEANSKNEAEGFDSFSKWAQVLLQDFNEIDRYLIPSENILEYLKAIQDINHWSLEKNQTALIKNYLSFWEKLSLYYNNLSLKLRNSGCGYQGLIYREAIENLESYIQFNNDKQHVFLGFNALNTAESTIIQELLHNGIAQIFWDIDSCFMNNVNHGAGFFLRNYQRSWKYFDKHPFNWKHDYYTSPKNVSVIGIPKNVGQAKYIGEVLHNLQQQNGHLNNTAVVLSDETLLTSVLNSLPNTIDALNITMGFPLKSVPLASLFDQLFSLHKESKTTIYFKEIVAILTHQFIRPLFQDSSIDYVEKMTSKIYDNNLTFLTVESLIEMAPKYSNLLSILFKSWNNNAIKGLQNCSKLILLLKKHLTQNKENNLIALEYLYRFNEVFNTIRSLNTNYNYINDIKALNSLYKEVLSFESLDFQGEPLQGLQVMGMLESRVLDFDTVIISSVNEGILPAGKSNNSFIPFDVKLEHGLPTYKEKDAIYTYHFYRLIQRAKNVYILYNTEPDVLNGGEKSRFITQMEIENIHNIKHSIVAPKTPRIASSLQSVLKSDDILFKLKEFAQKGISPSALTNYIRNPLDFYYQKVLGVKEFNNVEETVAANTLGTVVHNTLEDFYKPLENKFLTIELLLKMQAQINDTVLFHFKDIYREGDITKGKNLIIFEIAKRFVSNFLKKEKALIEAGHSIKIIQIEADLKTKVQVEGFQFPVILTGKVDRVDEFDGTTRIIDYKTGKVEQAKVEVVDWESITTDYTKYSKSFQILMYTYMMRQNGLINAPVEAGIISFKNLNAGFLKFAKKDSVTSRKKDTLITEETLINFKQQLDKLVLEIFNPKIDFVEKELS